MQQRTRSSDAVAWLVSRFLLTTLVVICLPSAAQAQTAVSVPASIPADCSADATAGLNAFFSANVPDNSVVSFPGGGCYLVIGTVTVNGKTDVSIEGNGSRLVRTELSPQELRYPQRNAFFRIANSTRVHLSGLNVEATNNSSDYGGTILDADGTARSVDCLSYLPDWGCYSIALEFEHAFEVLGSVDTSVSNVSAKDIWGDGVYVAGRDQFTSQQGERVTLLNVSVDRNGRQGMAVNRIQHVLIDGFILERGRRSGIDIEPDTGAEIISDIEIRNSVIETNLLAFASYGRGESSNVYIHGNVVTRTGVPWIYVRANDGTRRYNWTIHNNDVQQRLGSPQPGLLFENVVGVDIQGNTNHYASAQPTNAVGLYAGSTATISCNWFEDAAALVVGDGTGSWTEQNNSLTSTPPDGCADSSSPAAPLAPSNLQATGFTDPRVDSSWTDNADNEDAFELLRKGPNDSALGFHVYLGADTQNYRDSEVIAGQKYCYQVVAHNGSGSSAPSNIDCATPASAPQTPASPTSVEAVATATTTIDISWIDQSADEEAFDIQRRDPGATFFWSIGTVGADIEYFVDNAAESGLEYCYQVLAVNAYGSSDPTNIACATTPTSDPAGDTPPAAPEQLKASSQLAQTLVELSWIDASENETSFEVHRRSSRQKSFKRIETLEANSSSYTDTRVRPQEMYCYRVLARSDAGASVSDEACVVVGAAVRRTGGQD